MRRIEPAPVPPEYAPPAPAAPRVPGGATGAPQPDPGMLYGVDLTGVAFVVSIEQLRPEGIPLDEMRSTAPGLPVTGVERLGEDPPVLAAAVAPFIGRPLSAVLVGELTRAVTSAFAAAGRPFASATVPAQDISSGVLQVVVIESRAGSIEVEGARWFEASDYLDAFRTRRGDRLERAVLEADLDWINRNPFRAAAVIANAGADAGSTDLIIRANERFPLRVYAGADDAGHELAGEHRVFAGFNHGDALGLGHVLSYQYTRDADFEHLTGHAVDYLAPLPWRHLLHAVAAYSSVDAEVPAPFTSRGKSWELDLRYEVPMLTARAAGAYAITIGFDFKGSDNNLEFARVPVTDNLTHIAQLVLGYQVRRAGERSATRLDIELVWSPGGLAPRNEDRYFMRSRFGAEARYTYARVDVEHDVNFAGGWQWRLHGVAQAASGALLGSEQVALGGAHAVRGYAEGVVYADQALLLRNELSAPGIPLPGALGGAGARLQAYLFVDAGLGGNRSRLAGEEASVLLAAAGAGLRVRIGRHLAMDLAYAHQLSGDTDDLESDDGRVHFSLLASY